jgi:hypothetical protein
VVSAAKEVLRRIPGAMSLRRFVGRGEHALALRLVRRQNILFTEFQRVPTQLAVLAGAVTDFLGARGERDRAAMARSASSCSAVPSAQNPTRSRLRCTRRGPVSGSTPNASILNPKSWNGLGARATASTK